jgi:Cellulase (glycosyl hydrolase family 5)
MRDRSPRFSAVRVTLCLFLTALVFLVSAAGAARGRAVVSGGTLLSDLGTPLRGLRYSLDAYAPNNPNIPPPPSSTQIGNVLAGLPARGINAVHVYAEKNDAGLPAGYNSQYLQDLVNQTAANGLYLVITIGGQPNFTFTRAFWTYYAPLFKNYTHVIYEIQNEPWIDFSTTPWKAQPSPANVLDVEADSYEIIRKAGATSTPVLLFTYAFFQTGSAVLSDIQGVVSRVSTKTPVNTVDWSHTAIGFHGYSGVSATQATMATVRGQGYAVVELEMACFDNTCAPGSRGDELFFPLVDLYEGTRTSWLSFLDMQLDLNAYWNQPISNAWVVWAADAGTFPGWSDPPLNKNIVLLSPVNGDYVRIDPTTSELAASVTQVSSATTFNVVPQGRYVALRVPSTGKYVQRLGTNHLAATATTAQNFEWIHRADGRIALQAVSNWRFTSADFNISSTPPLVADRARGGGPWEGLTVQVLPSYEGYQDALDCFSTVGWAWDRNNPNGAITVDVYDGSTFLGSATANLFRQDLLNAGKGNGYHGFTFSLPSSIRNGGSHTVSVKYGGTATLLGTSPKTVTCAAALAQ